MISRNNGVFATVFNAAGAFVNRAELSAHRGRANTIAESALPANAQSYLTATYPGYVFSRAFSISGTTMQGYVVIIEANSTRYALQFDAAGNFVRAKTIR